ncbi:hypothetical protein CsSME_00003402 [Camellia sinensis var. sinensis]
MEKPLRSSRASQTQSSGTRQRRSGYEPSDTETEWLETPWHDLNPLNGNLGSEVRNLTSDQGRNKSPYKISRRHSARFLDEVPSLNKPSKHSPVRRRHSKSPYKPRKDDGTALSPTPVSHLHRNVSPISPRPVSDSRKNVGPFANPEIHRHISPYKPAREDLDLVNTKTVNSNRKQNYRQINKNVGAEERGGVYQVNETSRMSEKSIHSRRSVTAPRTRIREMDQQIRYGQTEQNGDTIPSSLPRNMPRKEREGSHKNTPSVGELNEMVANVKISRAPGAGDPNFQSTDSISPGDIFFSHDYGDLAKTMQNIIFPKNGGVEDRFSPMPQKFAGRDSAPHQRSKPNSNFGISYQGNSSSTVLTQTTMTNGSAMSRQSSNKISTNSSKVSAISGRTNGSVGKFVANRRKSQTEAWFSCIKKGPCRTTKSPEKTREFDEASYIEKAFVVESLRQFWADKHQPASLNGFICHKQEVQVLKQLVSDVNS